MEDVLLRHTEDVPWDDDQPLVRSEVHAMRQMGAVDGGQIPADHSDIAIVELPDVRALVIAIGVPQFFGRSPQPTLE
ncbi:hypothetical protein M271_17200 [Streptomyces rapamycinicus NRRL 5491]|nr:hypothetical protein M271_17200 [Streptomyces rapamycinicus NRRL 5491]